MINEINIKKIYQSLEENQELTTKLLKSYGFTSKDLKDLIDMGKLERVKKGLYEYKDGKSLFEYATELFKQNKIEEALIFFEQCYSKDLKYFDYCFTYFLELIKDKNYEEALKCFKIFKIKDSNSLADFNLMLYLLSFLMTLEGKYLTYVKYLQKEDLLLKNIDEKYSQIDLQNKIRTLIFYGKFGKARFHLYAHFFTLPLITEILVTLLNEIIIKEKETKEKLLNLYQEHKYQQMLFILEDKCKKQHINIKESYTIELLNVILKLQKEKTLPIIKIYETNRVLEAIDGFNYELALKISNGYLKNNSQDLSINFINLLLKDICDLQKELKQQEYDEMCQFINNLSSFYKESDLNEFFSYFEEYITKSGNLEYQIVLKNALKWSLLQGDINFSFLKSIILQSKEQSNNIDINGYILNFQELLRNNRFFEACVYLELINSINDFNEKKICLESYQTSLEENELFYQKRIEHMNSLVDRFSSKSEEETNVQEIIEEIEENEVKTNDVNTTDDSVEKLETLSKEEEIVLPSKKKEVLKVNKKETKKNQSPEEELIEQYHKLLMNGKDLITLKPMSEERLKQLESIVKSYKDIAYFFIGQSKKQLVLKYNPFISERINFKELIELGNEAYKNGNYKLCIEYYKKMFYFSSKSIRIYAKLGLAYAKLNEKEKAIDFLTVATELNKLEKGEYDYTEIINVLKGIANEKPYFKMSEEDFFDDVSDTYGFENLEDITNYILESGLDVRTAAEELNFKQTDIDDLYLIYAKLYFAQGNYEKGEQFLKAIEKRKGKSSLTKRILSEIQNNKRFYKYRSDSDTMSLSLKLKP